MDSLRKLTQLSRGGNIITTLREDLLNVGVVCFHETIISTGWGRLGVRLCHFANWLNVQRESDDKLRHTMLQSTHHNRHQFLIQ